MSDKPSFHVKISRLTNGLYRHDFYYATDLRYSKDIPCVDASAIDAWCSETARYNRIHIHW